MGGTRVSGIAWREHENGNRVSISLCTFDLLAKAVGSEQQVSKVHANHETTPQLIMHESGNFMVVWSAVTQDGDCSIHRRVGSKTGGWGESLQVTEPTKNVCEIHPRGAVTADGDVMLVWVHDTDNDPARVRGAIYPRLLAP